VTSCNYMNTRIKPGQRLSPATEFKPGHTTREWKPWWEKSWLENQYVILRKNCAEIAKENNLRDSSAIGYWLRKHGIKARSFSETMEGRRWVFRRTEAELINDFWKKIKKGGDSECWNWTASKTKDGYGRFRNGPVMVLAHRFSFALKNGEIPSGILVCHKCDNAKCCNPSHLFLGTNKDNCDDKIRKGRSNPAFGVRCSLAKLNNKKVQEIRDASKNMNITYKELSKIFKVSTTTIANVIKRRTWRHI
jgi:hypothetical protein